MCLVVFSWKVDSKSRLTLLANRDEYFDRPTKAACFRGNILSGKDLKGGGTWLAISRQGRVAAITNYRDPTAYKKVAQSRGELVNNFLTSDCSAEEYLNKVSRHRACYNPFNLLIYDGDSLYAYSSQNDQADKIEPGIHALSNHHLNSDWPKVVQIKAAFSQRLHADKGDDTEALFRIMENPCQAKEAELPKTGVSLEWEKQLSAIFIKGKAYGTRSTTLLKIDQQGHALFIEKSHYPDQESLITCNKQI